MHKKMKRQKNKNIYNVGMGGQEQGHERTSPINLCELSTWKYMSFIFNMLAKFAFLNSNSRIKKSTNTQLSTRRQIVNGLLSNERAKGRGCSHLPFSSRNCVSRGLCKLYDPKEKKNKVYTSLLLFSVFLGVISKG